LISILVVALTEVKPLPLYLTLQGQVKLLISFRTNRIDRAGQAEKNSHVFIY
jgi:hypothetical protein